MHLLKHFKIVLIAISLLKLTALPGLAQVKLTALPGLAQDTNGKFKGSVIVEWLRTPGKPDRTMKLKEKFEYQDPNGTVWSVPKGAVVDGASIPLFFWRTVGPPFVGNYREASVVHDYYCETRAKPWKEVHRMFYHAALAGGVPKAKAKAMYAAVYAGGPRWQTFAVVTQPTHGEDITASDNPDIAQVPDSEVEVEIETNYDEEQLESEIKWVEQNDPSLETIEQRINDIVQERSEGVEESSER